jgi:serine protease Do
MRVALAAVVMFSAATVLPPTPAAAGASAVRQPLAVTNAERAVAIAEPAVVTIEVTWEGYVRHRVTGELLDDQSVSASTRCSGVGVSSDGYLLTTGACLGSSAVAVDVYQQVANRRVSKGLATTDQIPLLVADMLTNATIVGERVTEPAKRTVLVRRAVTLDEPIAATVVSIADPADGDAALIKIEKSGQPMVQVAGTGNLSVGTEVVTVECSAQDTSAVRPTSRAATIAQLTPIVIANNAADPASPPEAVPSDALAGGVVLTLDANIAGLVSRHQGSVDLLTPLPSINEQLTTAKVENALGEVDRDFRAGLDALYEGRYTDSIERFDAVLAVIPSHIQAHAYRDEAQEQRDTEGGGPRAENGMISSVRGWLDGRSGTLVAVALLAVIAVFLIRRKGRPRAATATPARVKIETPTYCENCSNALPQAAATCPTCGKPT